MMLNNFLEDDTELLAHLEENSMRKLETVLQIRRHLDTLRFDKDTFVFKYMIPLRKID